MSRPVRVPADVNRPDRVLGPLTARQLGILGVAGLLLSGLYSLTRAWLPLPVFLIVAVPVGIAVAVLALGQRDGVPLDRLVLAAIRQHLSPRHRVAAPEGVGPAPAWLTAQQPVSRTRDRGRHPVSAGAASVSPVALELPASGVADTGARAGVVDLSGDGLALIAACSTVNFSLRTPGEQEALVASFARYLHSLTAPVQILVRAERLDLAPQIAQLRARAPGLPHPALEAAALDHADYLAELTAHADLLRRQVLLVLREPLRPSSAPRASSMLRWRQRDEQLVDGRVREAAEQRLVRRLDEATDLLSSAGIVLTPLDAGAATGVLASACNPDTFLPPSAQLASSDDVVTSTTTFTDLYGPDQDTTDPVPQSARRDPQRHASSAAPAAPERTARSRPMPSPATRSGPWLSDEDDFDYDDEIESR
ncbi:PrgI family protein [Amycolatopsis tolypomycina]|uniref:PrgI family protein n=1 Tax=Amycolatopsis tolypomycina TaxID=208445 RepID=A0A1H4JL08_9PSEU|nr:PrgI family protein [Amycolatopsis tolypomycina]SEB46645.1 PrgI family protein [Amycolatopsis tolypomycina]